MMRMLKTVLTLLLMSTPFVAFLPATAATQPHTEQAVFAGGCFWGMEAVFERLHGVTNVVAGFSGGSATTAHYEVVSTGITGHAESVEITFNPEQISYKQLLEVYFRVAHDPTEWNYQGPDHGKQYRSVIFFTSESQQRAAHSEIDLLTKHHVFSQPIVTQVVALHAFYAAENYHQHYYDLHPNEPYIVEEDVPKVHELLTHFPQLVVKH